MTTKFKIGDKVEIIQSPTNYFIIGKIVITRDEILYSAVDGSYQWPEIDIQLKKEKIKKYKYAFIDQDHEVKISVGRYETDIDFFNVNGHVIKYYQRIDIGVSEVEK